MVPGAVTADPVDLADRATSPEVLVAVPVMVRLAARMVLPLARVDLAAVVRREVINKPTHGVFPWQPDSACRGGHCQKQQRPLLMKGVVLLGSGFRVGLIRGRAVGH